MLSTIVLTTVLILTVTIFYIRSRKLSQTKKIIESNFLFRNMFGSNKKELEGGNGVDILIDNIINAEVAKKEFVALKELGVSLALDDFGTSYSSFFYLRDFPLDTSKIDLSFVRNIITNKEHQKIVKAMIDLGHNFELKVVAEGVEDDETYQLLKSYNCDEAQGYYFSKPLPAFEFQELIRKDIVDN